MLVCSADMMTKLFLLLSIPFINCMMNTFLLFTLYILLYQLANVMNK